jgi:hypothetical protein
VATSRSRRQESKLNDGNTPYNKNGVSVTEFEIRAELLVDVHTAPQELLKFQRSAGMPGTGPWSRTHLVGPYGTDFAFDLQLANVDLFPPGNKYPPAGVSPSNRFREIELTYRALHAFSTPLGDDVKVITEQEEVAGAKEIGEEVAQSIPSHLPNYKYIREVARAAAEAGAKMGYKKAREER